MSIQSSFFVFGVAAMCLSGDVKQLKRGAILCCYAHNKNCYQERDRSHIHLILREIEVIIAVKSIIVLF